MKTALCVAVKNALCIDSYCNHYLNTIGFDKIYLFEDKGSYPHKPYVKKFGKKVEVYDLPHLPWKYYEGKGDSCIRQIKLYTWFLEQHKKDYDWIAFFDDDEYMMLPEGLTLKNFLKQYNEYSSVYLYWDILRTDDINEPTCSYLEQTNYYHYIRFDYNVEMRYKIKSIVNTKLCNDILNVHFADKNGVDVFGNRYDELTKFYAVVQIIPYEKLNTIPHIKHFYIRSFESWFKKIMIRGEMMHAHRKLEEWFLWTKFSDKEKEHIINEMILKYRKPVNTFETILQRNKTLT